jgi:predicted ArsR family transcriptional regulator
MDEHRHDSRLKGARGAILNLLRRGDLTVAHIASGVGLTDNGVRLHLARLVREGLVEEHGKLPGVSKASRLYGLAPGGRVMFTRAHAPLVQGLLDELRRRNGTSGVRRWLQAIGRQCAREQPANGTRFKQRVDSVLKAFRGLGGDPVLARRDSTVSVVLHDCPLADVVSRHPEVCAFGQGLVSELAQVPVTGRCAHGPRPSCRFDLAVPQADDAGH